MFSLLGSVTRKTSTLAEHCHVSNHTSIKVFRVKVWHDFIYSATALDIFPLSNYSNENRTL
ncbi:hypothetical protein BT93_B0795 [Corymbia citriodora subsp. variegata]|nr:hypothetical protein BT93_B0795 [Corymbia citriodora subsp. variegata]